MTGPFEQAMGAPLQVMERMTRERVHGLLKLESRAREGFAVLSPR